MNKWLMAALIAGVGLGIEATEYLSPEYLAAAPDGGTLYVTAATGARVLRINLAEGRLAGQFRLKNRTTKGSGFLGSLFGETRATKASAAPSGITAGPDGALYVTGGGAAGFVQKLMADGTPIAQVAAGHTPVAPITSPDGQRLFILSRFDNCVRILDAKSLETIALVPVLREPFAAALGANGKLLFVANLLPACRATDEVVAAAVSVIDTAAGSVLQNIMLPNGSTGVRGACAAPDGAFVYVTHTLGRFQLPTTQLERGWMNTAALSVFNGATGEYVNTVLLDDVDLGAANPWGVAVSPDGAHLVVAHAGTRELSVIDRGALHARLDKAARGERVTEVTRSAGDVPNDLSFLVSLRRRVKLEGDGPRGLAIVNGVAYAPLYFADTLVSVKLDDGAAPAASLPLGAPVDLAADRARRGEMLFNDATMCFQHWQSCASCHTDGVVDALNWDLLNDGIGNPKQSKSMLYVHLTPPTMVTGIRPDMQACNRKGLIFIQFVVRPEEDALCLDAYSMALKPVPSPTLEAGRLSAAARRGEKLFKQAGCADCHPPDNRGPNGERLYTNLKKYNLGLGAGNEEGREFDTPTLNEVWRTAPYLYDGRALTIEELLTTCNPDDKHGRTSGLSQRQIADLAEYVLSL